MELRCYDCHNRWCAQNYEEDEAEKRIFRKIETWRAESNRRWESHKAHLEQVWGRGGERGAIRQGVKIYWSCAAGIVWPRNKVPPSLVLDRFLDRSPERRETSDIAPIILFNTVHNGWASSHLQL